MGVADTYRRVVVGVHFGEPGREVADPYFGGAGPSRRGCVACGNCMVGCRHDAKNTLDRNYLWLAERGGADVFPEREAVDLVRLAGRRLGRRRRRPGLLRRGPSSASAPGRSCSRRACSARSGSCSRRGERGRLPGLSPRLGERVRTNREALVGATAPRVGEDLSRGIAIGSVFRPTADTTIEPVRYGRGSNAMAAARHAAARRRRAWPARLARHGRAPARTSSSAASRRAAGRSGR